MSGKPSVAHTPIHSAAFCLTLLLLAASPAAAQPSGSRDIPVVRMPLAAWVASRPHAFPDTLANFETPPDRITKFRALLQSLVARNWAQAAAQARSMDYLLVMNREGGRTFVAASDNSQTGRDPTVIMNLIPRRDFIVGAPHVPFDREPESRRPSFSATSQGAPPSSPAHIAARAGALPPVTAPPTYAEVPRSDSGTPTRATTSRPSTMRHMYCLQRAGRLPSSCRCME